MWRERAMLCTAGNSRERSTQIRFWMLDSICDMMKYLMPQLKSTRGINHGIACAAAQQTKFYVGGSFVRD